MASKLEKVRAARVLLWGKEVGAVAWDSEKELATFEYTESFLRDRYDIAPLTIPRKTGIVSFPELSRDTFYRLPGLLADSIPDKFGNALIDTWLLREGRSKTEFSPVERLCYIGTRGMGALEFEPAIRRQESKTVPLEIARMIELAQHVVDNRLDLLVNLEKPDEALETIIRIGTSAGGARAKALIGWHPKNNEVRSGQVPLPKGYEPWIIKFDGVEDKLLGSAQGFGRIEYAYYKMATKAGIVMMPCRLFEENGRAHFMTQRFDRELTGEKIHMQSLCALAHYDFNNAGAYGYEQVFEVIQKLNLGYDTITEMYRRMIFNVVARNQDDHTKNIAFLMGRDGAWKLAPAFDVIWAYSSSGVWTNQHQMSINGKRDNILRQDLSILANKYGIKNGDEILDRVIESVGQWAVVARSLSIPGDRIKRIGSTHRLKM